MSIANVAVKIGQPSDLAGEFNLSVEDLLTRLALDNYCMVPCQG